MQRCHASLYALVEGWQGTVVAGCSQISREQREQLFIALEKIAVAPPLQRACQSCPVMSDFMNFKKGRSFDSYGSLLVFVHLLINEGSLLRQDGSFLTPKQLFQWIAVAEFYLGIPLKANLVVSLLAGAPISKQALTELTALHTSWRNDIFADDLLFLNSSFVNTTLPMVLAKWKNLLVDPEPQTSLHIDNRRCLAEMLVLATWQEAPRYRSALLQLKGLAIESKPDPLVSPLVTASLVMAALPAAASPAHVLQMVAVDNEELQDPPQGSWVSLSTALQNRKEQLSALISGYTQESQGTFGRHLHCRSVWRYSEVIQKQTKETIPTFNCSMLLSPELLKERSFDITLGISLETLEREPLLVEIVRMSFDFLTLERYPESESTDKPKDPPREEMFIQPKDSDAIKIRKILYTLWYFNQNELLEAIKGYLSPEDKNEERGKEINEERCKQIITLF